MNGIRTDRQGGKKKKVASKMVDESRFSFDIQECPVVCLNQDLEIYRRSLYYTSSVT